MPGWKIFGVVILVAVSIPADAQLSAQSRIGQKVGSDSTVALKGSTSPLAQPQYEIGRVGGATKFSGVSIHFKLSAAQQADLDSLLQQQQDPASPNYHKWLTPAQYASRFGMTTSDLAKVQTWLESKGFTVDRISNSHTRIFFSGTAAQIESAFQTKIHNFNINGEKHAANATPIYIPSSLSGIVSGIRNISDFRPQPRVKVFPLIRSRPRFTSSESGDHYLAPEDVDTIDDILALYNSGYTGSGEKIAIVGQSYIEASDIANFRSAAGLPTNAPVLIQVPDSGTSTYISSGDETESDLDIEWSGAIAKAATIDFVYTGSNTNYSVFDSLQYAIDNDVAPIISMSYGDCEANYDSSDITTIEALLEQANSQGQTVILAAGDSGATDCDYSSTSTVVTSAIHGLAVDYPGSSSYVTTIGGTEFSGDDSSASTYWNSGNNANNGSVIKYIPEEGWNETSSTNGLTAGGGGKSVLFGKPSWQNGDSVPSDGARDVPDISLDAAIDHDGYLICSSDSAYLGITGSCADGFRNSSGYLTVGGGTSFGAPIFAGVVALMNQKLSSSGQGNINSTLYTLAASASSSTYFHDITTGNNEEPCTAGSTDCPNGGDIGYSAGTGYDLATGIGSIDAGALGSGFSAGASSSSGSLPATTTTLTASSSSITTGTSVTFTATVAAASGSTVSGGTVEFAVDGTNESSVTLTSGVATYTTSFTTTGTHVITATYSGSTSYASSSATLDVNDSANSTTTGSFTLTATDSTISQGSSGTSTVTITSVDDYAGTVTFTATASSSSFVGCYGINNTAVTADGTATATLTIYTAAANCSGSSVRHVNLSSHVAVASKTNGSAPSPESSLAIAGLIGLLLLGSVRKRTRLFSALAMAIAVSIVGLCAGCKGFFVSTATTPTGTYIITVTGTDTSNSLLNASTTFTLTVD